jgi:hypothetical protein
MYQVEYPMPLATLVHMLKEQGKNSTVSRTVVTNWE